MIHISRWKLATTYNLPYGLQVRVLKAYSWEPVKYYTEMYRHKRYQLSFGSKAPTKLSAMVCMVIKYFKERKDLGL
jgi:hypothetical protein